MNAANRAVYLALLFGLMACGDPPREEHGGACAGDTGCAPPGRAGEQAPSEESPCIEELTPLPTNEGLSAIDRAKALLLATGTHYGQLRWRGGEQTGVALALSDPTLLRVHARENPAFTDSIARMCTDRVIVRVKATLTTSDGKLREETPALSLDWSADGSLTGTWGGVSREAIRGSYADSSAHTGECLLSTQIELSLRSDGFSGELHDVIANQPCEGHDAKGAVSARTGGRWSR